MFLPAIGNEARLSDKIAIKFRLTEYLNYPPSQFCFENDLTQKNVKISRFLLILIVSNYRDLISGDYPVSGQNDLGDIISENKICVVAFQSNNWM